MAVSPRSVPLVSTSAFSIGSGKTQEIPGAYNTFKMESNLIYIPLDHCCISNTTLDANIRTTVSSYKSGTLQTYLDIGFFPTTIKEYNYPFPCLLLSHLLSLVCSTFFSQTFALPSSLSLLRSLLMSLFPDLFIQICFHVLPLQCQYPIKNTSMYTNTTDKL